MREFAVGRRGSLPAMMLAMSAVVSACSSSGSAPPVPEAGAPQGDAMSLEDGGDGGTADGPADARDASVAPFAGVYVTNEGTGDVSVFTVDGVGDVGSQTAGSPFATGTRSPSAIAANADRTRLYVSGLDANGNGLVTVFTLDAAGNISGMQSGSPVPTGVSASSTSSTRATLNPAGTRLYLATAENLVAFAIDATGNLAGIRPGSPIALPGSGAYGVTVNPGGTRLYVTSESQGLFVFGLDANGDVSALRPGAPFGPSSLQFFSAVHPASARLYVTGQTKEVVVYTLDANGDVSGQQKGSPFAGPDRATGVIVNAAGTRLYVTNAFSNSVSAYPLDPNTGDVTGAAVPFDAGVTRANDLAIDRSGTRLYVLDYYGSGLSVVSLSSAGDPVAVQSGSPFSTGASPFGLLAR